MTPIDYTLVTILACGFLGIALVLAHAIAETRARVGRVEEMLGVEWPPDVRPEPTDAQW